MVRSLEQMTMRKVYLRILPFAALTYFMCYLDRINVGFAALTMNKDLGLDAATYGMAAGMFFWGYVIAEVPSNIVLEKIGARIWIARIMVTWGIISGATATRVTGAAVPYRSNGSGSFRTKPRCKRRALQLYDDPLLARACRSGLVPRLRALLHLLVPRRATAPASIPASRSPCRSRSRPARRFRPRCLGLDGLWGLRGWQVLYIFEAIPTVLIGVVAFFYLTDGRPGALAERRAARLARHRIGGEQRQIAAAHGVGILRSFWDPKVIMLSLNYIGIVTASLGMLLFLPTIIKELGITNMQVGWVTMIPYICGAIAMVFCGWLSDRIGERRWTLFWTCVLSAVGLIIAGLTIGTWWSVVGMSIAAAGFYGTKGRSGRCRRCS